MKTNNRTTEIKKAIKETEIVICPTCGCKNNYHYSECIRVSHLFKNKK